MVDKKVPSFIELVRRGKVAQKQGRYGSAHDAFAEAILLNPDASEAYLGAAAAAQAAAVKAEASGMRDRALELRRLTARHYLALALLLKGRDEAGAYKALTQGLNADAENAQLWAQLALILREGGQPTRAEAAARRALALDSRLAEAHLALSLALSDLGRFSQSDETRKHALQLATMNGTMRWQMEAASLLALHYRPELTGQEIFAAHCNCSLAATARAGASLRAPASAEDPDRRLRVGYVSGDFCTHSVAYFFEPLLVNHDPARVETFCYANVARPDATTERMRKAAHHWRNIVALDDVAVRQQIKQDRIDILVDLSGYTRGNRLSVFSVRTAPIAATWLGYPGSTGLSTIDYRITDAVADPPGMTEALHTEALIRLPHAFLCYRPPASAGDALAPPPLHARAISPLARSTPFRR